MTNTFVCPVCVEEHSLDWAYQLSICSHRVCWKCCVLMMRSNRQLNLKCPECRAREPQICYDDDSVYEESELEDQCDDFEAMSSASSNPGNPHWAHYNNNTSDGTMYTFNVEAMNVYFPSKK